VRILDGDRPGYYDLYGPKQTRTSEDSFKFKTAADLLFDEDNFQLFKPAFGDGSCDREKAFEFYKQMCDVKVKTAKTKRARNAAYYIAKGGDYDYCDYDENIKGPFDQKCLERVAREAGFHKIVEIKIEISSLI
jgi:hypothetical protein